MKNFLLASVFVLAFCFSAFSQISETLDCPIISVQGPAGVTSPGELMIFTVNLDGEEKTYDIKYVWSVSGGKIIEGQGTSVISAIQPNASAPIITTVTIKGLPEECPNNASEMALTSSPPESVLLDEFSLSEQRIDKARMDNFFNELQNNPNDQGYIFEKFKRKTSKAIIKQKLAKVSTYIKLRGFDPSRITVVKDTTEETQTQFWRVPPGAPAPTID